MKKRILSILLTLVMVIGMLPAANLTAYAAETTEDELFSDLQIHLDVNGVNCSTFQSTSFSQTSSNDWSVTYSKQKLDGNSGNMYAYYINLDLYDGANLWNGITLAYKVRDGAGKIASVIFTMSVSGTCSVSELLVNTNDYIENQGEGVMSSACVINLVEGAMLNIDKIHHTGVGRFGGNVDLQLLGGNNAYSLLNAGEIINDYVYLERKTTSGRDQGSAGNKLIIVNKADKTLFQTGTYSKDDSSWTFGKEAYLFFSADSAPAFAADVATFYAPIKYGTAQSNIFAAYDNTVQYVYNGEDAKIPATAIVGDDIDYQFYPALLGSLRRAALYRGYFSDRDSLRIESNYRVTNLTTNEVVAYGSKVGTEDVSKDNPIQVKDNNGDPVKYDNPGRYHIESEVILTFAGQVIQKSVKTHYVDVFAPDFSSLSPTPTSSELSAGFTDLGTANLGAAETDITFAGYPTDMPDGWTTGRSITVTRDGVDFYSKTYASNEVYGWNLKDNIDEGGNYKITLKVFAQNGSQTLEKTHTYQINVKGSTIKTIVLTGVGTPVIGKAPSTINTVKCNTDGVIVKKVVWTYYTSEMGGTWVNMPDGGKFEADKRYAVEIELQTADGYSFTANKSDMTVYINGEKAGKSVNYDSNKFSAELEFESITTPVFTTQPVGGEAPYGGTYTVNWATNFTPVKIVVGEYNFRGSIVKGTEYSGDLTSIALKPNTYGYAIIAYYNDDYAAYSNSFYITEAPIVDIKTVDVFIEAPVEGNKPSYTATVPADAGYTVKARYDGGYTKGVMWETNGEWMHGETKFEGGQDYVFTVLIQPKEGYEFYYAEGNNTTEPNVAVTVNGNPAIFNKDSNWLIVQYRFTVKGTTLTGSTTGGINVTVENLKNSATLIVAQYEGGRMVDVQTMTVSADNTYNFTGLTHKDGCTYKAMLVNSSSYAPLCKADNF